MKIPFDPTKTITLRNRVSREIDVKFKKVRRRIVAWILGSKDLFVDPDKLESPVTTAGILLNAGENFEFTRDADKVSAFNRFVQQQINEIILFTSNGGKLQNFWMNTYMEDAYTRGARKTRLEAERGIRSLNKVPNWSPWVNPQHLNRAELIFQRVFESLEGITEVMSKQMSYILSESIAMGKGAKETATMLADRVDKIGITRAKLLARTEIVETHNVAAINEGLIVEEQTGVVMMMKWTASIDGRERPSHRARNGKLYTKEEVRPLLGEPNCRCSISAVFDEDKFISENTPTMATRIPAIQVDVNRRRL